ncbi:MAG: hypothetical protein E2O68_02970 [Deltaproteobacteria bacterium]|nr:MAG: hypothetical protein E2O68_02970 [Deltaproteobacteria bacterium]
MKYLIFAFILTSFKAYSFEGIFNIPDLELPSISDFSHISDPDDEIGGGWIGNGGDFYQTSQNIWFLGSETINYCIESSKDYPLSESELRLLVKESIGDWKAFFKKYGLDVKKIAGDFKRPRFNFLNFVDGKNRGINLYFKYNCKNAKLTFFFGRENKLITTYKKLATEHPFGLAIRKSYNHKSFINQGVVWIANFSEKREKIKHTLLHELGHILGMKHNSVFVMEENLGEFLSKDNKFRSNFLGQIETDSWWYRILKDKPLILSSRRGRRPHMLVACPDVTFKNNNRLPRSVLKMFKLGPNDCHRISLTLIGSSGRRNIKKRYELKIEELVSGKLFTMNGVFSPSKGVRPHLSGPGVFTQFKAGNRLVWKRLTLDKNLPDFPKTGVFSYRNVNFATKMTSHKGVVIEMYLPMVNRWWTLKTVFNR